MTVPTVLFSIETWVLKQKHCISLTAAEMYYLRSVRGCTRHYLCSKDIRQELNVTPIFANIDSYRKC